VSLSLPFPSVLLDNSPNSSFFERVLQKSVSSSIVFPPALIAAMTFSCAWGPRVRAPGKLPDFIICMAFFLAISNSFFLSMCDESLEEDRSR
jgi:hypothetical protein